MAGRGTDIILGGNPIFQVKQILKNFLLEKSLKNEENNGLKEKLKQIILEEYKVFPNQLLREQIENLPYSLENTSKNFQKLYSIYLTDITKVWENENKTVKELEGLYVIGTERHETRRLDNQLRGRAGRQGDPGISQFFLSLDDDLLKVFGGKNFQTWMQNFLNIETPLESGFLTKSLEDAQEKIELYNYEIRKNVFEYDNVVNCQREKFFQARKSLLDVNNFTNLCTRLLEFSSDEKLFHEFSSVFPFSNSTILKKKKDFKLKPSYCENWITNDLRFAAMNFYEKGFLEKNQNSLVLDILDYYWTEHLERMNYCRETINWRSYGQLNPLVEYNFEATKSYKLMFQKIKKSLMYYFLQSPLIY
jgi:preprotein translocase subunit SecA